MIKNQTYISLCIVLVVFYQLLAIVVPSRAFSGAYLWPFYNYPMFSRSFELGQSVTELAVIASMSDGEVFELKPGDLGLNGHRFYTLISVPLVYGNTSQKNGVVAFIRAQLEGELSTVSVRKDRYLFRSDGLITVPPQEVP